MSNTNITRYVFEQGCTFCCQSSILISPQHVTIKLDYLEAKVLAHLCAEANELVLYQELFNHWQNRCVGDGVLTRVISSLRAKLKAAGCTQPTILNKSKRGYMLVGDITSHVEPDSAHLFHRQHVIIFAICVFILMALTVWQFIRPTPVLPVKQDNTPFVVSEKLKIPSLQNNQQLAIHQDGQHIAAVGFLPGSAAATLALINPKTKFNKPLSAADKISNVLWFDKTLLIYQACHEQLCYLKQIQFDEQLNHFEESHLFQCERNAPILALSRSQDNLVIVRQPELPYPQIQLADLTGQPTITIDFADYAGYSVVDVAGSADSEQLFLLLTDHNQPDLIARKIVQTSAQAQWQTIWQHQVPATTNSLNWFKEQLSYSDQQNVLATIHFEQGLATSVTVRPKTGIELLSRTDDTWFLAEDVERKHALTQINQQTFSRNELLVFKPSLHYLGRLQDGRFIFQDHAQEQQKLVAWSLSSYLFSEYLHLDEARPIIGLQELTRPTSLILQTADETLIGRKEHKKLHINNRLTGHSAIAIHETLYLVATPPDDHKLIKTSIYPTAQAPTVKPAVSLLTALKEPSTEQLKPVYTHHSKLGIWIDNNANSELLVDTMEPIVQLLGRDDALYYQVASGKHYIYQNGQSRLLELRFNDQIIDFDSNYLYAINDAESLSTVSIFK